MSYVSLTNQTYTWIPSWQLTNIHVRYIYILVRMAESRYAVQLYTNMKTCRESKKHIHSHTLRIITDAPNQLLCTSDSLATALQIQML